MEKVMDLKTLLLVSALCVLLFMFGIEVGAFEERQRNAHIAMRRYMRSLNDAYEMAVHEKVATPENPARESGGGPEA